MERNNTILIKPASYLCNMHCKYCFYLDEVDKRKQKDGVFMEKNTLENIIVKFLENTNESLSVVFQGGEPLLVGLDFYKETINLVKKHNINNIKVYYSLQTNGTLIDDNYAKFFKENNFLIGLSIDGTREIHNKYRIFKDGKGSYDKVIEATRLLDKYKVDYNVLTVITNEIANSIDSIYKEYKYLGFNYLQFIPCLDNLDNNKKDYSLDEKCYYQYLIKMFNHWYEDIINDKRWFHRYFDTLLNRVAGYETNECSMNGKCTKMFSFEANGDVYPCDFYMLDNYKLGNINQNSIEELVAKEKEIGFIEKSETTNHKCLKCKYYVLCKGGCKRERNFESINRFCKANYKFFEYAYMKFKYLIRLVNEGKI